MFKLSLLIVSVFFYFQAESALAQIHVSATIKPLQLITMAITDGVSSPELVLASGQNSHHESLRPSGRRVLASTDLLVWVGPVLESSLEKVVKELNGEVVTVQEISLLDHRFLDGNLDPHMWISPQNAIMIASEIAQVASRIDEENQAAYLANLDAFEDSMTQLIEYIELTLMDIKHKSFAVYHNAFQYYETSFGLEHVVSFTNDEDMRPNIRRLLSAKEIMQESSVSCLLVEPGINTNELTSVLENDNLRYISIDVMGNNLPVSSHAYFDLIMEITNTFEECLR